MGPTEIKFTCPFCSQKIAAPTEWAGQLAECPTCKKSLEVPFRSIRLVPTPAMRPREDLARSAGAFGGLCGLGKKPESWRHRALRIRRVRWLRDTAVLWVVVMAVVMTVFALCGEFDLSGIKGRKWLALFQLVDRWIPLTILLGSMGTAAFVRFQFDHDPEESDARRT